MTKLHVETIPMPAATLGGENPLPAFRHAADDLTVNADSSVDEDERRRLGWGCAPRILPYRLQDGYDRDRQLRPLQVVVLENEHLRVMVAPELGGKLLSLFDKNARRELLDRNPVFQPANLALRNAWCSGGVEFNAGQYGHHHLTCSPMFAASFRSPGGEPALRIYEWNRVKCFPYQIDFHLPAGSRFLLTHVRIVNPHEYELPMYWWTNIAVPENERTRVICPADSALHPMGDGRFARTSVPMQSPGIDLTYARNMPAAHEYFFCIPQGVRPWEAAVEADGTGLLQVSTALLRGRKVFYWGMNQGGRNWQEFLSLPGRSYIEIQAGLARTQNQHVPMPAGATWEWTEAFGGIAVDPTQAHSSDWNVAKGCIEVELAQRLPEALLNEYDRGFAQSAACRADKMLFAGSGWAALERCRLAAQGLPDRIPAELDFGEPGADQTPWLALLETNSLPPADSPGHLMTQPEWQSILERSIEKGRSDHWLASWHLGNMRMENRDAAGAKQAWTKSMEQCSTGWALRNLAVLTARSVRPPANAWILNEPPPSSEAAELFLRAWEAGPPIVSVAIEAAQMLLATGQHARLAAFARSLPAVIRSHERIRIFAAAAAVKLGNLDEVEPLFQQTFATIREGETTLTDIWFEYHARRLAEGKPVDDTVRARAGREFPPPKNIDFRMIIEAQ
ncbi:MAG: DUF5107 domain-containing protein [Verrucomicrobiae bacterium]